MSARCSASANARKHSRLENGSAPISRILLRHLRAMTVIPLGRTLPHASSYLPAGSAGHTSTPAYLVLLQVEIARFTQTELARLCCSNPHLAVDGGYPLPCPVESGLSSTKTSSQRPSGALPHSWYHAASGPLSHLSRVSGRYGNNAGYRKTRAIDFQPTNRVCQATVTGRNSSLTTDSPRPSAMPQRVDRCGASARRECCRGMCHQPKIK